MDDQAKYINKIMANPIYSAVCKLNEGSYGQIYKAQNIDNNQQFAMKVLDIRKLDKQQKLHEALIEHIVLQKLDHPGIIKLYDVFQKNDYVSMVLELAPFGDLFALIKNINKSIQLMEKKQVIMKFYLAEIVETLDYLHSLGIVHRDIKPQNIVIGKNLHLKLVDFGTCKPSSPDFFTEKQKKQIEFARKTVEEEDLTSRKSFVGSASYLSPEGLGFDYTDKNDIWSFGVLAYKFCFNRLPFKGTNNFETFQKIAETEVVVEKGINPAFEELVSKCLKKNPNERLSAKELKQLPYFSGINFKTIFQGKTPIVLSDLKSEDELELSDKQFVFQCEVEKKMFFGNYKPRLLTISKQQVGLFMAYRYIPTKKIKRQTQLSMNSYAHCINAKQFEISAEDKKFVFKVQKKAKQCVQQVNAIIKNFYNLG